MSAHPLADREIAEREVATSELDRSPALTTARAGFGAVVLAAGVSGLALLIAPESVVGLGLATAVFGAVLLRTAGCRPAR